MLWCTTSHVGQPTVVDCVGAGLVAQHALGRKRCGSATIMVFVFQLMASMWRTPLRPFYLVRQSGPGLVRPATAHYRPLTKTRKRRIFIFHIVVPSLSCFFSAIPPVSGGALAFGLNGFYCDLLNSTSM
jgi:hypothetical protein